MFVKRVVMSYPSMLSFRQLGAVVKWMVELVRLGTQQHKTKDILELVVLIKEIYSSTTNHWNEVSEELSHYCSGSESL